MISGKKIELNPFNFSEHNIRELCNNLNNQSTTMYQNKGNIPLTIDNEYEYIKNINKSENDILFGINTPMENNFVGTISLQNIDWINRSAMIGIIIFQKYWKNGYGKEACTLINKYGFLTLNLHRIWATAFVENIAMNKIFEQIGFKHEGTIKDVYYKNGLYHSINYWNNTGGDFS